MPVPTPTVVWISPFPQDPTAPSNCSTGNAVEKGIKTLYNFMLNPTEIFDVAAAVHLEPCCCSIDGGEGRPPSKAASAVLPKRKSKCLIEWNYCVDTDPKKEGGTQSLLSSLQCCFPPFLCEVVRGCVPLSFHPSQPSSTPLL